MFLTSFVLIAVARLGYRQTAYVSLLSFSLSLWDLWSSCMSHHTQHIAWLASACWTVTLVGAGAYRPLILLGLLAHLHPGGLLTGLAVCLPAPCLKLARGEDLGISRTERL